MQTREGVGDEPEVGLQATPVDLLVEGAGVAHEIHDADQPDASIRRGLEQMVGEVPEHVEMAERQPARPAEHERLWRFGEIVRGDARGGIAGQRVDVDLDVDRQGITPSLGHGEMMGVASELSRFGLRAEPESVERGLRLAGPGPWHQQVQIGHRPQTRRRVDHPGEGSALEHERVDRQPIEFVEDFEERRGARAVPGGVSQGERAQLANDRLGRVVIVRPQPHIQQRRQVIGFRILGHAVPAGQVDRSAGRFIDHRAGGFDQPHVQTHRRAR